VKKADLVQELARRAGLSRSAAARVVDALFGHEEGIIVQALRESGAVKLGDLGSIQRRERAERTGRNPRTAAEIVIPARSGAAFRPGKRLKDVLSGGGVSIDPSNRTIAGGAHGSGLGGREHRAGIVRGPAHGAGPGGRD
jgi:DNA-binding protein HU-beta